jgi:acetolactate synthase-1/2/3 large subunit
VRKIKEARMGTVGTRLVEGLRARGVEVVFGIPGVHTIELYRGLPGSGLRHVTPRHEGSAGFMADGYARATGRPGVCFVITGPGLTNVLTAMGQARAESVPMLVISSTLARGHGRGALHELPDQAALAHTVAVRSETLLDPARLGEALDNAFAAAVGPRAGPAHLEVPVDVLALPCRPLPPPRAALPPLAPDLGALVEAAARLSGAYRPVILAGGGARWAAGLPALARALDAPVVQTANARGLMAGEALSVAASPSLGSVRDLMADADVVLALGTEMGPTDYDMYGAGGMPALRTLVRVDSDAHQLAAGDILADSGLAADALLAALPVRPPRDGAARAARARGGARAALSPAHARAVAMLEAVREALPGTAILGDSTEPVYAGNLLFEPGGPGLWANSSTGFGTLGWGLPAAVGHALATGRPTVALVGDGGLQFTLAELGTLADEGAPVTVLVWNNRGYREIEAAMREAGAAPVGVTPTPPDFVAVARAWGLRAERPATLGALPALLRDMAGRPGLIDLDAGLVHAA